MRKLLALLAILTLGGSSSALFRFTDDDNIPNWAYESIQSVREAKIMQGNPDGSFQPDRAVNRAEALIMLLRTKQFDYDNIQPSSGRFRDVNGNHWFSRAVAKSVEKGWINGFSDGSFRPGKTLNRAEWATLIMRAFDLEPDYEDLPSFRDVPSQVWFTDAVYAFYKNDLIRYPHATHFDPEREVSRSEAAWTIAQILQKPRLMGTSQSNDFSTSARLNSREVAILPRDFNPHKQGIESTRKELLLTANRDLEPLEVNLDSDWTRIGNVRISNPFGDRITLNSIEFILRFERTDIGPASDFLIKMDGPGLQQIVQFNNGNRLLFSGLDMTILPEQEKVMQISIMPKEGGRFYTRAGEATLSIESADAITISAYSADDEKVSLRNNNLKRTPIKYAQRLLTPIYFNPIRVTK